MSERVFVVLGRHHSNRAREQAVAAQIGRRFILVRPGPRGESVMEDRGADGRVVIDVSPRRVRSRRVRPTTTG